MVIKQYSTEKARTYWWLIYTKCRQLNPKYNKKSNRPISFFDLKELATPCKLASEETKKLLEQYIKQSAVISSTNIKVESDSQLVYISSFWLWSYFGYLFYSSETFNSYFDEKNTTPHEQFEFYQYISSFSLLILKEIEKSVSRNNSSKENGNSTPPLESIEGFSYHQFSRSMIFLLSEYCHRDIGLPREMNIEDHLQTAIRNEANLYLSKDRYRDHVYHVIDVCLLGWFLLNLEYSEGKTIIYQISEETTVNIDFLKRNWFLASLFHDIGYSLLEEEKGKQDFQEQTVMKGEKDYDLEAKWKISQLNKQRAIHERSIQLLELQRDQFGMVNVPITVLKKIDDEKDEVFTIESQIQELLTIHSGEKSRISSQSKKPLNFSDNKFDHGERSAQYVEELLIKKIKNQVEIDSYFPSIQAIRKHTQLQEKIDAYKEPLSFLLVLCDELQDWDRPQIAPSDLRERIEAQIIFSEIDPIPIRRMLNNIYVSLKWKNESRRFSVAKGLVEFHLVYSDPYEEQFQPLLVWLSKIYNLQRLLLQREVFLIQVNIHQPLSQELIALKTSDIWEFYILQDFYRKKRNWYELKEWTKNNDLIRWNCTWKNSANPIPKETISIDINGFTLKQLLPDNPSDYFKELIQFRKDYIRGGV